MAISEDLDDANRCPCCGRRVPAPRKGFAIHVAEQSDCDADLDAWRELAADLPAGRSD